MLRGKEDGVWTPSIGKESESGTERHISMHEGEELQGKGAGT
jgi:hypothetical protein